MIWQETISLEISAVPGRFSFKILIDLVSMSEAGLTFRRVIFGQNHKRSLANFGLAFSFLHL